MKNIGSNERRLDVKIKQLDIKLKEQELIKREADLELVKEQIRHKRFVRRMAKVTTTFTGLSLIASLLVHFGLVSK